jgi:hypothetical protein
VSLVFYLFLVITALLLLAFVWSLRTQKGHAVLASPPAIPQDFQASHVTHLPQIRRALAAADYEFAAKRISTEALRRMRRERRHVALAYLAALRMEFDRLLRTARIIAVLSPEVAAGQELERVILTVNFLWRYRVIRMSVWAGYAQQPQISVLTNLLSGYSIRLEEAMRELGERAALVAEMVSSPDRRRIHPL